MLPGGIKGGIRSSGGAKELIQLFMRRSYLYHLRVATRQLDHIHAASLNPKDRLAEVRE